MKPFVWIPVALVAGLVIGAWGPRSELRRCREEVEELEELLKSGRQARASAFAGVTQFLRLPDERRGVDAPARSAGVAAGEVDTAVPSNAVDIAVSNDAAAVSVSRESSDEEEGGMKARLEAAANLWRVRSDIARSAFVANAGLDDEQTQDFDVMMAAMNLQLRERIEFWAEEFKSGAEMTEETGLRMMNDMSSVLVTSYEEMDAKMPTGWRGEGEKEVNLTDFVDPMVAEPLIDVEDKLQRPRPRRNRVWPRRRRNEE